MITFSNIGHYGRLGNQMFQYGILYVVAKKNSYNFAVPSDNLKVIDSRYNPVIGKHDYMYLQIFECFDLSGKMLPSSELKYTRTFDHGRNFSKYNSEVFDVTDNTNFKGFFQSYKYFEEYKKDIQIEFTFKTEIELEVKEYFNKLKKLYSVNTITGLHIRNGDNLNDDGKCQVLLNKSYYHKAMERFRINNNLFLIISDDIEWCKSNLDAKDVVYSEYSSYKDREGDNPSKSPIKLEYLDLCAMTYCDNFIMSNSSFCWWGAWLNKKDGMILCPDKWWGPVYNRRSEIDIRPTEWVQQPAESNYEIPLPSVDMGNTWSY